ncbi:hypothetical protein OB2597_04945 [Pseudooceanicola batsensis HTCC2597]|uniref:Uncharacterized protein n=1 Tax=Pseudooceanicola batsensis (strain ATCC BAA-863 / DSM 15984 / KCTC 12145 / HTCC2597) TaxID=252305 RepID=A3TSH4_PSEBH|nr:hypothetical protein [Pseudooceanicola batsensis]EAQ04601.1 hypothetical protein OB2597_04945 [Pseudooceanicola batsensis HTCC2597]
MSERSTNAIGTIPASRLPGLGRRGWILVALAVIGTGMALNWGWLTAIGAAPLILSFAPCAAMCALGLCMRGGSSACANKTAPAGKPDTPTD